MSRDSSEFRRGSEVSTGSFSAGDGMVMLMGGYAFLLPDGDAVGLLLAFAVDEVVADGVVVAGFVAVDDDAAAPVTPAGSCEAGIPNAAAAAQSVANGVAG